MKLENSFSQTLEECQIYELERLLQSNRNVFTKFVSVSLKSQESATEELSEWSVMLPSSPLSLESRLISVKLPESFSLITFLKTLTKTLTENMKNMPLRTQEA